MGLLFFRMSAAKSHRLTAILHEPRRRCDGFGQALAPLSAAEQCTSCDADECANDARRSDAPASLRAVLEAAIDASQREDAIYISAESAMKETVPEKKEEAAIDTSEREDAISIAAESAMKETVPEEKEEAGSEEKLLVGGAERLIGHAPVDCQAAMRALAARVLTEILGKELAALVGQFAPFRGTEDLPLLFARRAQDAAEDAGYSALAVDEWRDVVYVARGSEIRVYDAFGGGEGARFAEEESFSAPIRGLALSAFPHSVLCVLDGLGVHLISTATKEQGVMVALGGEVPTCICVDPISNRLLLGCANTSLVRLLPTVAELVAARGVVAWAWQLPFGFLENDYGVRGITFGPVSCRLFVTTNNDELCNLHVSAAAIMRAAEDESNLSIWCTQSRYVAPYDLAQLKKPRALCFETRSGDVFACEANCVAQFHGESLLARFPTPEMAEEGGPRAIAIHARRRILYIAGARHVRALEITSSAWRLSETLVADCAAMSSGDISDGRLAVRPLGLTSSLREVLCIDAQAGIGSAAFDAAILLEFVLPLQEALKRPDQAALGAFYALCLSSAKTRVGVRQWAAALMASGAWPDDYVGPFAKGNLELRYTLYAFDRGALWALVRVARMALHPVSIAMLEAAQRVLRSASERGDALATHTLGRHLSASKNADERSEGNRLLLDLAEVNLFIALEPVLIES